jgi:hypothetical protein
MFQRVCVIPERLEQLMCLIAALNTPSPFPARTDDGVEYSAKHLVA